MKIKLINPQTGLPLTQDGGQLIDDNGSRFPIINDIPRFVELKNYAENFSFQWDKFAKTQLDQDEKGFVFSKKRFFAETLWEHEDLSGKNILEVGSGAGRFSRVVLEKTMGTLYSVDYSEAVETNKKNNQNIAPKRFNLFQASIDELPFPDNLFDKVFCLGVLQHTPNFERSVKCLIDKVMVGGEVVVDFYPINGWWTKIHAKYILRPLTKRMSHESLLNLIEKNIDWLIKTHFLLHRLHLGLLTRFLPVCDIKGCIPSELDAKDTREIAILDTFDQYSPEYDNPQKIKTVAKMFQKHGAEVTFAGRVSIHDTMYATVVRAVKTS